MKTVRQIIGEQHEVWGIDPDGSGLDALKRMAENNVSALAVVEAGQLVGIVTERDFARKVLLRGFYGRPFRVRDIMTPTPLCAGLDHTSEQCMALMIEKHIRHLPVVGPGGLVGMLSMRDLMEDVLSDKDFVIEQMRDYIAGGWTRRPLRTGCE